MLMFGWQGATCIDEWTMAACNFAIGATLMLGGSGAFSFDNALLARKPALAEQGWFRWMSGALPLPVNSGGFQKIALAVFAATVLFNVGTYNYYRGSVITPFHGGPVSPTTHHLDLTNGVLLPNGAVHFHAYLDGGTPEAPSNVMTAELQSNDGSVLEQWDGSALSHLPASAIANEFAYNRFAAAGGDRSDGDNHAACRRRCGHRPPPERSDAGAAHRQRSYVQRCRQTGIGSKRRECLAFAASCAEVRLEEIRTRSRSNVAKHPIEAGIPSPTTTVCAAR
jgi:hypothetical protein